MPAGDVILVHLAAALVALAAVGAARWWVRRGANRDLPAEPTDLAYLNDGPRLAVLAGLVDLHERRLIRIHHGVIDVRRAARRAEPDSPLQAAILATLRKRRGVADLLRSGTVEAATHDLGAGLAQRGWVLSARQQTRMLRYGIPGWIVAVWCLLAFALTLPGFAGPGRSMQALILLGLAVFLAVGTYLVADVPPATRAGRAVLRRARKEARGRDVPWSVRVAAYGEPELWKLDAQLAERVGAFSGELPPFPSVRRRTFLSKDWWEWRG